MSDQIPPGRLRLQGRRVLIRRPEVSEKIGSIYLPDRAKKKPQEGIVVATNPHPCPTCGGLGLQEGERVLFGQHAPGVETVYGLILKEADIMAVLSS